jgi:hypothetical protein
MGMVHMYIGGMAASRPAGTKIGIGKHVTCKCQYRSICKKSCRFGTFD